MDELNLIASCDIVWRDEHPLIRGVADDGHYWTLPNNGRYDREKALAICDKIVKRGCVVRKEFWNDEGEVPSINAEDRGWADVYRGVYKTI
mgnify:FL=1